MELANTTTQEISLIDDLAEQAKALRASAEISLWQLARVLVEAEPLVPHGKWEQWLEDNAGMSVRSAQQAIQTYKRFNGNPRIEGLGRSQMIKLLALPEGTENEFLETHDVADMSAREVERAVKDAKAEMQAEIERERAARLEAEKRAEDAESRPPEIPEELTKELAESREEIERLKASSQMAIDEGKRIAGENSSLKQQIKDKELDLEEQQEQLNKAQYELDSIKKTIARGDAERVPADQLTLEVFTSAVRQFMGTVFRMPSMQTTFGTMDNGTKEAYSQLLDSVEKWAKDSRLALETTGAEGTVY